MLHKRARTKETAFFHVMCTWCTAIGLALVVSGLAACAPDAPPALSLQEAKRVSSSFEGEAFTPPPKSIEDVTAILDAGGRKKSPAIVEARAMIAKQPPAGLEGDDLAKFYSKRALAAIYVGNAKQGIADQSRATQLVQNSSDSIKAQMEQFLGMAKAKGGNFTEAIRHFERAVRFSPTTGAKLGRSITVAQAQTDAGRLEDTEKTLARIKSYLAEAQFWSSWSRRGPQWSAGAEMQEAHLLMASGRLAEAETLYRSGIRKRLSISDRSRFNNLGIRLTWRALAENLLRQGRLVEAEVEARKAVEFTIKDLGVNSPSTAHILSILISVIDAQGRHADAERLARETLGIFERAGSTKDSLLYAVVRRQLAGALANQKRWRDSLAVFNEIEKALASDPQVLDRLFTRDKVWPLALLGAGRTDAARSRAETALTRLQSELGDKHYETAAAKGILALILAKASDRQKALSLFRQALPILLSRSRQSSGDNTSRISKQKILNSILSGYIDLNARIRGTAIERAAAIDSAHEAFHIADVARSQSVQGALAASSARAAAGNEALAELIRREQDARKQIAALFGIQAKFLSETSNREDSAALGRLRARIDVLRRARATLAEEIEKRFPDYAALMNPKPATVARARASLRPGEALIATYVGEKQTYVWAVPKTGMVAFVATPLGRAEMAKIVGKLRRPLDPDAATLGDIPRFDVHRSHALYSALLKPVAAGWKDAKSLLVVAHGPLGQLPFSVLVTKSQELGPEKAPLFSNYRKVAFLARSHAVTVVPSVSSLITLRGLPQAPPGRRIFAGFGDPWFSEKQARNASQPAAGQQVAAISSRGLLKVRGLPVSLRAAPKLDGVSSADLARLPRLPDTADEVKNIALATNADLTRDVFTGRDANEERVKTMNLSGYKVIAFATHGLVPGDLNGLTQPALALSSPKVTGGKDDGLLTMGEILALKLDADWVVLSACNTASANGAGAEAVSGLGRAFFYAGTRALLVSNWPVETTSARALTTDIFQRQAKDAGLSRAQALRQSMLNLIDKGGLTDARGKMVFSYAHPIFWAPFSLVGDGGGGEPAS